MANSRRSIRETADAGCFLTRRSYETRWREAISTRRVAAPHSREEGRIRTTTQRRSGRYAGIRGRGGPRWSIWPSAQPSFNFKQRAGTVRMSTEQTCGAAPACRPPRGRPSRPRGRGRRRGAKRSCRTAPALALAAKSPSDWMVASAPDAEPRMCSGSVLTAPVADLAVLRAQARDSRPRR